MNLRFWLLILVLALAAAGTWWLLRQVSPQVAQTSVPVSHAPDYFFTDAKVTTLNKQGKPEAVMTAPRMLHHPDDGSVDVFAPRLEYFVTGGQPWHLSADHAVLPSGGKLIELKGHVQMQHPGTNGAPALIVHTDKMNINLNTNIATTHDAVVIVQGKSRMTAQGMQAYMQDNRLQLLANVQGHYEVKH